MKFYDALIEVRKESVHNDSVTILAASIYWGANAIAQAIYSLGDSNENAGRLMSDSVDQLGTAIERSHS